MEGDGLLEDGAEEPVLSVAGKVEKEVAEAWESEMDPLVEEEMLPFATGVELLGLVLVMVAVGELRLELEALLPLLLLLLPLPFPFPFPFLAEFPLSVLLIEGLVLIGGTGRSW